MGSIEDSVIVNNLSKVNISNISNIVKKTSNSSNKEWIKENDNSMIKANYLGTIESMYDREIDAKGIVNVIIFR